MKVPSVFNLMTSSNNVAHKTTEFVFNTHD